MADPFPELEATDAALSFWSIFEHSRIPMALLDRERRYVRVTDALVNFWEYPRSQLLGSRADSMVVDERDGIPDRWEQLVRSGQLYGQRIVEHACGTQLHVTYAAHVITVGGNRQVLVLTLSARLPHVGHLLGDRQLAPPRPRGSQHTPHRRPGLRLATLARKTHTNAA